MKYYGAKPNFPSNLRMWSHDCIRNTSPSYFSALCNSLQRLRAPIHAENTWNNQVCTGFLFFFLFFLLTSTNAQTYTITHTHTLTHTNAGTTFMPCDLARHYANGQTCHLPEISLRQSEIERERKRERERERVREGNSAHLPVCESSLSSVSTVHTQGAWNLATVICNVLVWGLFDSEKKKRRERDTWSLRSNVELF